MEELADIYQKTTDFIKDALVSVENNDVEKAQSLIERHKEINNMERVLRKTHIKRLNKGECSTQAGVNYIDTFSHYTRVSDHAMNLAEKVIAEQSKKKKSYPNGLAFFFLLNQEFAFPS